jgi:hypothetical protein
MSNQPEALRLATSLEGGTYLLSRDRDATAAELRRLHEAVRVALSLIERGEDQAGWLIERGENQAGWVNYAMCVDQARDVLRAAYDLDGQPLEEVRAKPKRARKKAKNA